MVIKKRTTGHLTCGSEVTFSRVELCGLQASAKTRKRNSPSVDHRYRQRNRAIVGKGRILQIERFVAVPHAAVNYSHHE